MCSLVQSPSSEGPALLRSTLSAAPHQQLSWVTRRSLRARLHARTNTTEERGCGKTREATQEVWVKSQLLDALNAFLKSPPSARHYSNWISQQRRSGGPAWLLGWCILHERVRACVNVDMIWSAPRIDPTGRCCWREAWSLRSRCCASPWLSGRMQCKVRLRKHNTYLNCWSKWHLCALLITTTTTTTG